MLKKSSESSEFNCVVVSFLSQLNLIASSANDRQCRDIDESHEKRWGKEVKDIG